MQQADRGKRCHRADEDRQAQKSEIMRIDDAVVDRQHRPTLPTLAQRTARRFSDDQTRYRYRYRYPRKDIDIRRKDDTPERGRDHRKSDWFTQSVFSLARRVAGGCRSSHAIATT